jgi:hypothetical protein
MRPRLCCPQTVHSWESIDQNQAEIHAYCKQLMREQLNVHFVLWKNKLVRGIKE